MSTLIRRTAGAQDKALKQPWPMAQVIAPRPTVLILALVAAGLLWDSVVMAQSLPAGTLPKPAAVWLQKGLLPDYVVKGNKAEVSLKSPATILNWNSLDVAKDASLRFSMVNATDRVLNNVTGGAINNRTTIEGLLQSNGQVYIYNPNGIVFSKTATVDVNALVASSLKIDDQRFMDGWLSPSAQAQLQADVSLGHLPGAVVVQGDAAGGVLQQAAITAAKNGFILLAAPTVINAGKLTAPDGQVALAAGTRVFLAPPPSSSTAMRGMLIEVGSQDLAALAGQQAFQPSATNDALGRIDVQHGNAIMVGRMVNQMGVVSANTSVSLNGSIYLKAQDGATEASKVLDTSTAKVGGELLLGAGSQNLITPDLQDATTAVKGSGFKKSKVKLTGQSIVLEAGAVVRAAGGDVIIEAKVNPSSSALAGAVNASRVELQAGSEIDVSGSAGVQKAMESNVITAELRGGELADNLLLRDSSVRGQKVNFDLRKAGTVSVADITGYVAQQGITVGEFTANGGTVSISSEGSQDAVKLSAGSKINVSGGWLDYQAGHVNTTKLSLYGKLFDFETAPANLAYTGLVNLGDSSLNFEAAYREGKSAGSVSVSAPNFQLGAQLMGQVSPGVYQRNLAASDAPTGAKLTLKVSTAGDVSTFDLGPTGRLDVQKLATEQGFRSFDLSLQGPVEVHSNVDLPPMTQLKISTPADVLWSGSVSSPGGTVSVTGLNVNVIKDIKGESGVTFDLAGRWVNDLSNTSLPAYAIKGGSLSLSGNHVRLGDNVTVDVSGGAWWSSAGKTTAGDAGSISLKSISGGNTLDTGLTLGQGTKLLGYGLKSGGKLSLTGRHVWVGLKGDAAEAALQDGDLVLSPEFLTQGGFASLSLTANGNLEVMPGTQLTLLPENWFLPEDAAQHASSAMATVASKLTLPLASNGSAVRPGSSLSLRASSANLAGEDLGYLRVGTGAVLTLDPGADASKPSVLTLSAANALALDGTLKVPAGQVNVLLDGTTPAGQIHLLPQARIDVSGTDARVWVDGNAVATGEVLDGGRIRIGKLNDTEFVNTGGAVQLDAGSVLNVSGAHTAQTVQLKSLGVLSDPQHLYSAAGSVDIRTSQGLWLGSTLQGQAGGGTAQGGTLNISLDGALPGPDVVVKLSKQLPSPAPDNLTGTAYVPAGDLTASGFTRLAVKSQNQIELAAGLQLGLGSALELNAPQLVAGAGAQPVLLSAPYVSLGNSDAMYQVKAGLARDGAGLLTVQANTLDLQGKSATLGFGQVVLQAARDIRLVGVSPDDVAAPGAAALSGRLDTGHALSLQAQQVYPSTLSQFEVALHADAQASRLTMAGQGGAAAPVLSAAGVVTLRADQIEQGGRLLAPQGQIRLLATESVVFRPGSVTSVAGNEATPVLLGRVTNGTDWTYTLNNTVELNLTASLSPNAALNQVRLPAKTIQIQAPVVQQQAGAVLDLSGGGQVRSYDFTPGPGGKADVLQNAFAVLPGFNANVAPLDVYQGTAGLRVGDQVYLSGLPGLAAGFYTLLPGHYALLPGGFALQTQSGLRDMSAASNVKNLDGSYTVSGYRSSSTDGRGDTRSSGFRVLPADVIAKSSEFKRYSADDFFQAEALSKGLLDPALPGDAGHLSLQVLAAQTASVLSLQGETRMGASQGQRGTVDVSAPNLEVVAYADTNTGQNVKVLASELMALGADSVLLGGQRVWAEDGVHVQVNTDSLRINNNSANALQGSEWLLAARHSLEITGQAKVQATGTADHPVQTLVVDAEEGRNQGAFVALSAAPGLTLSREGRTAGVFGRLDLATGASVGATGSMWLDATSGVRLDASLNLARDAWLGLTAPRISLGDTAPEIAGVALLRGGNLLGLNRLASLTLGGYDRIDAYGDVSVGNGALKTLSLASPLLMGHGGSLTLKADAVRLSGLSDGSVTSVAPESMAGTLKVSAGQVQLGDGRLDVQGFADVRLESQGDVVAAASSGQLLAQGAMTVSTSRLATLDGAEALLAAGQDLKLLANGQAASQEALGLGGTWLLQGRNVAIDTLVSAPSGQIVVQASQAATSGVTVNTGRLEVQGQAFAFGTGHAYTPGGTVVLDGGAGAVTLGAQSVVNVGAKGADAGVLQVNATGVAGAFTLQGTLIGAAQAAQDSGLTRKPLQGSFSLDVHHIDSAGAFDALNATLNAASMTESRDLRVRQGDVSLSATGRIQAHEISVAVDNGSLSVAGELDARGAKGGQIGLYAAQSNATRLSGQLTLASTAVLRANATQEASTQAGSVGDGGTVVLAVSNATGQAPVAVNQGASLWLKSGALVDVSAAGAGQNGTLTLRAPRTAAGTDVSVAQLKSTITGSRETVIEAVKTYQAETISELLDSATNLNAGSSGQMATEALRLMSSSNSVLSRLQAQASGVHLTPGVEVRSAGDLTVSVNEQSRDVSLRGWNLNAWRPAGEAGTLTLRAQGNLTVRGSISDGFVNNQAAMPNWALDTSDTSWRMRLVGGADASAAKMTETLASANRGDVVVDFARAAKEDDIPVALVRSGTGSITVAAGRNVVLGATALLDPDLDVTLDQHFGAAMYTAGYARNLTGSGLVAPVNASNAVYGGNGAMKAAFGTGGGAIEVTARHDVVGAPVPQLVNEWLFRQGRSQLAADGVTRVFEKVVTQAATLTTPEESYTLNTAWWTRPDYFGTGVATLAGGDLSVRAGGSVKDVLASVASNAYLPAGEDRVVDASRLVEQGGGDLTVRAGQNILGGQFYVQKGNATLRAGQSVAAGSLKSYDPNLSKPDDDVYVYSAMKPVLALGDGSVDVTAGRSLAVEAIYNPTLTRQSTLNVKDDALSKMNILAGIIPDEQNDREKYRQYSGFNTYSQLSAVRLTSLGGDVELANNSLQLANMGNALPLSDNYNPLYVLAPSQLKAVSIKGDIAFKSGMALAPSSTGQLELMAKGSIKFGDYGVLLETPSDHYLGVAMLDMDPASISQATAPLLVTQYDFDLLLGKKKETLAGHKPGQLHASDVQPVRLIAQEGDILFMAPTLDGLFYPKTALSLPKKAEIVAGRDVRNLGFDIQNNAATDQTMVIAGRDIVDATNPSVLNAVKHTVTGPGLVSFVAGRDIDLGNGYGVVTRGNLDNPYLPEGGAAISALAGVDMSVADAAAKPVEFENKSAEFLHGVITASTLNLAKFDAAISDRFAVDTLEGGNILVGLSQFKTEQKGAIDLMAPKGSVIAGLTNIPDYMKSKGDSENGIFTVRGGAIRVFVGQDFIVNQGRVFTLGGGDITLVSQYGNIDAGRGSKTASSAPPPLLTTDASGNTKIDISGSISGSGIATLKTSDKQAASDVVAIAPRGIFDAGDAGVRSTGKVEITAAVVLNGNNISAAAGVSGGVAVDSGAAPAPASASAAAAPDASRAAAATAAQSLSLSVDVMGYGAESAPAADEDKDKERSGDLEEAATVKK